MKKRFLRLMAFILCFSIVLPQAAFASASTEPSSEAYEEYALESMKRYLKIWNLDDDSDFTMTQPIPVSNDNDEHNRAVFCFKDGVCMAEMMITYVNGSFASSFV